jgi:hypothetical protein
MNIIHIYIYINFLISPPMIDPTTVPEEQEGVQTSPTNT